MKRLYISAWIALIAAVLVSGFTATLDAAAVIVYSLISLALFYTFALWSVMVNSPGIEPALMPVSGRQVNEKEVGRR